MNCLKNVSLRRFKSVYYCNHRNNMHRSLSMTRRPTLYGDLASPPVRFVMMTAATLGLELNFHKIDLFSGENRGEFYKTINPLMKVPALVLGDDVVIRDSHAIALYLCRQSDHHHSLYPADLLLRTAIDDLLFFNASALFPLDSAILTHFFSGTSPSSDKVMQWNFLLDYLDNILNSSLWLVGDMMTLADLCCITTVTSAATVLPISEKYININKWIIQLKKLPCFEINSEGIDRLKLFIEKM